MNPYVVWQQRWLEILLQRAQLQTPRRMPDLMDGSRRRGCAQKKQTIHPVELTETRSLSTGALIMSLTL